MTFSRPKYLKRILEHKLRRVHTLAGGNVKGALPNPDFKIQHAGWARDAATKNFAVMDNAIREEHKTNYDNAMIRRNKLVGK